MDRCTCGSRVCSFCGKPVNDEPVNARARWTEFEEELLFQHFKVFCKNRAMVQGRTGGAIQNKIYDLIKKEIKTYFDRKSRC